MFQKKFYALVLLAGSLFASSCDDKKEEATPANPVVTVEANLTGAQQAVPNQSTATGELTGTYNKETRLLTYKIVYRGMATPTLGHFHRGPAGVEGPVSVPFPQLISPIEGTATLSELDGASLLKGEFYANLHRKPDYPNGEIRGDFKIKQ